MAPPELTRDAPVPDVLHPGGVLLAAALGDEPQPVAVVRLQRRRGEGLHLHEPLIGQTRLDYRVTAVAVPDRVAVTVDSVEQAERLELLHHQPARLEAIETAEPLRH